MAYWNVYVRRGRVFVPTVAKTEAGYFLDIDPVEVMESGDLGAVRRAVHDVILRGNPIVPTPTRDRFPKPVVLAPAKVSSWSAFAKSAVCLGVSEDEGLFRIEPMRTALDGGWEPDPDRMQELPGATADDVAEAVARYVREMV